MQSTLRSRGGPAPGPGGLATGVLPYVLLCALMLAGSRLPASAQSGGGTGSVTSAEIERRRQDLERNREEIATGRQRAEDLKGQERNAVDEVDRLDRQTSTIQRYLTRLQQQETALTSRLDQLAVEIETRQADLDASRLRLSRRIRQMYKRGQPQLLEVVFAAESLPDLLRRIDLMARLAHEEKRLMADIHQASTRLVAAQQEVEQSRLEVQLIRREKDAERGSLLGLRSARQTQLRRIETERLAAEAAVGRLVQAQQELERLIQTLEDQLRADGEFVPVSGPFANTTGRLPWPVRGQVVGTFGKHYDSRQQTTIFNKGIDIRAPAGAPIRAVAAARVVFRDWMKGYGHCIILNHGGGYFTFYGHADEILTQVGATVASGEVIARVGDTGSLKGVMLHFELLKGTQALDPQRWLVR